MGITTTPMGHTRLGIAWYLGHGHTSRTPQSWHANAIRIVNRKIVILKAGMTASLHPPTPHPVFSFHPVSAPLGPAPCLWGERAGTSNIYEGYREEGKRFDVNTSSLPAWADGRCGGQPCAGQSRRAILWLHHLRVSHQKKKKNNTFTKTRSGHQKAKRKAPSVPWWLLQ